MKTLSHITATLIIYQIDINYPPICESLEMMSETKE